MRACSAHVQSSEKPSSRKAEVKDALLVVAGLALEVAKMTKGVPYIETLSSLITHIQKIDEVCSSIFSLLSLKHNDLETHVLWMY